MSVGRKACPTVPLLMLLALLLKLSAADRVAASPAARARASFEMDVLRLLRSLVRPVTCDSVMLPEMVLAVPFVMSVRKATLCVVLFLSWKRRWMSLLVNHTSPRFGVVGATPLLGTFKEAAVAEDAPRVWMNPAA